MRKAVYAFDVKAAMIDANKLTRISSKIRAYKQLIAEVNDVFTVKKYIKIINALEKEEIKLRKRLSGIYI